VLKVAVFIAGAGIVGIGVFVAIAIHLFALTLLPVAWATLTPALAWSAGGLVGLALAIVAFQLLEHGDLHFAAQAITAAGVYAALPLLGKVVLALAWPQWSLYALSAVGFALGIAYVYPALHALFKSGFMRKIIEGIKWMLEKTYDENDEEYRTFFAHLVTLIGACALAIVALTAASVLPVIPAYAVYAAAAVVFLVAYLGLGDFFDGDAGAVCTGLLASAATGYYFYDAFAGAWQGIVFWPALVGAIVITFTFAVPMAYIALRAVTRPWLSAPAGKLLDGLHDRSYKAARAVSKWWDKEVIKRSYDDTTPYRELFSHVANLTIVGLGIWKACPTLVGWLAAPGLWSMAYLGGFVFLGYVTYLLLGRTLKGIGSSALGFAAGIAATIYTGYNLYQLDPSYWWVAALIGLTAGSIVTWILFPVAYMVVRFPANLILTPWLRPLLVGVFDFLWKGFEGIWNAFVAVYKMVHNAIFAPFIRLLAGVFKAARDIWESVLGRKRS
ncbi:MAG: hypothetical protein K8F91_08585, partial [Candidatus Obscuribacterales bacterium]|nr:hypothetical protein [Candidatus Obscuribacterales bacterium]